MTGRPAGPAARPLLHKADFERVLATPSRTRSAHFAVHHVASGPSLGRRRITQPATDELSTSSAPVVSRPVDDSPAGHWLGSIVPKRHARRAATRNLLKRQIRAAVSRHLDSLPRGLWLVRLKAPFAPEQFPSAASDALRSAARAELERLLQPLAGAR